MTLDAGWWVVGGAVALAGLSGGLLVGSPAGLARRLRAEPGRGAAGRAPAVGRRARGLAGVGVALFVLLWFTGLGVWRWPVGVGAGILVAFLLGRLEPGGVARERQQLISVLPITLDLLRACLRAGLPLRRAVSEVGEVTTGPMADRLNRVNAQLQLGAAESAAWRDLADDPVLGRVARDIARAVESGVALDRLLAEHATEARAEHRALCERRARTVGVRTVLPLMSCFLPAFLAVGIVPVVAGFLTDLLP